MAMLEHLAITTSDGVIGGLLITSRGGVVCKSQNRVGPPLPLGMGTTIERALMQALELSTHPVPTAKV
jgi:hypothetical protein